MTTRIAMFHLRTVLLVVTCFGGLFVGRAFAQKDGDGPAGGPLEFRRILVPADRIREWPLEGERYVPVKPEEFERLCKSAQAAQNDPSVRATSRVVEARFTARLVGSHLVAGHAVLDIVKTGDTVSLLPLSKCTLAVNEAYWLAEDDRPATVGMAHGGDLTALVERSGQLALDWTLRGSRDLSGAIQFQLELPPSPVSTVLLDLPAGVTPVASHGIVSQEGRVSGPPGETSAEPVADFYRWRIELGGNRRVSLRMVTERRHDAPSRLPLVRQASTYDLSRRGIEIVQRIEISVENEPLRRLSLEIDPELRLLSARLGETRLPWSLDDTSSDVSRRVTLAFAEPIVGTGHVIEVAALAPLSSTSLIRLPRIRALDTFWQEGTATLRIESPLSLKELRLDGCRRIGTGRLVAAQSGELIELQYFSRDAAVELHVAERTGSFQLSRATTVRFDAQEASAEVVAQFTMTEGELYEIAADVAWPWMIDSMKSTPAGAVAQWSFDEQDESVRRLRIRLSQAVLPNQPLILHLRGRRVRSPLGETLGVDDLLMLSFPEAGVSRQLLALRAAPPLQLRLSSDDSVSRLDPDALAGLDEILLPQLASGENDAPNVLLSLDEDTSELNVSLSSKPPVYSAKVRIDATIGHDVVDERYSIACRPESAPVDRVLVRFSHRRNETLKWTLDSGTRGELRARRLNDAELDDLGLSSGGETWQVVLQRPQSESFIITADGDVPLNDATPASLVSLPDATSQSGELVVHSRSADAFTVVNHRLKAVPSPPPASRRYSSIRASYVYRPAIDADPAGGPALTFSRPAGGLSQRPCLIWDLALESRCEADGRADHLATMRIENHGRERISFSLPAAAKEIGVWIDGTRVPRRIASPESASEKLAQPRLAIEFPLPASRRFVSAAIRFRLDATPLATIDTYVAPFPVTDDATPALSYRWRLMLPPGFESVEVLGDWQCDQVTRPSIASKLFGPLVNVETSHTANAAQRPRNSRAAQSGGESAATAANRAVWLPGPGGAGDRGQLTGWTVYELRGDGNGPARVTVANKENRRALQFGAFLLVTAIGWWLARKRPLRGVVFVALFGIIALVVPAAYVPFCSAAFLGAAVSSIASFWLSADPLPRIRDDEPQDVAQSPRSPAGAHTAGLFVGVLLLLATGRATAADAENPHRHVYDVLIPANERGEPNGDRYQVPHRFLDELHERVAKFTDEPRHWLLERAVYRGRLNWDDDQTHIVPDVMRITFEVQVYGRAGSVVLPLRRDWLTLLPDSVRLDGQRVAGQWQDEGSSLVIEFPEPGQHQLELAVRPTTQTNRDGSGFDLLIPPVTTSRLELDLPPAAPSVEVPSALGSVSLSDGGRKLTAALGPTDRVSVRWHLGTRADSGGPILDVHELLWLKVQQDSVVLDTKLVYTVRDGRVQRLAVAADPRLRLVPRGEGNLVEARVGAASGSVQSIEFELPQAADDNVVVAASFLLTGASGVGNLRLPRFEPVGVRSRKRWLAVSVDESLEHELESVDKLESLAAATFLLHWGPADGKPNFAVRLPSEPEEWHLVTRPRPPQTSARTRLALSIQLNRADVHFVADLTCTSGFTFQHQLRVPGNLEIENISVIDEQVERVSRWSRNDDSGEVTVFLNGPVRGRHELTMTGRLPMQESREIPLPEISVSGIESDVREIDLYRQTDAIVEVDGLHGLKEIERTGPSLNVPGRLIHTYSADAVDAGGIIRVRPNEQAVQAVQVTTIRRDGDAWEAEVACRFDVTQGVLDTIEFDVPTDWKGPLEVDPPHEIRFLDGSEEGRRRLVVRPSAAVSGVDRVVIRGPLSTDKSEPFRAPQIRLLNVEKLDAYLILPTQFELHQVAWETQGLAPTSLPEQFRGPPIAPESFAAYQVADDDFDAILRSVERAAGITQVHLADTRIACLPDASFYGATTFDLEPGGASSCPLTLPPGSDLVELLLDGVPATGIAAGEREWQVNLGPERLPQRIEVVFRGRFPSVDPAKSFSGVLKLSAPSLENLPVERTLWTVQIPSNFSIDVSEEANPIEPFRRDWLRLRNIADVLEMGTAVVTKDSADGIENWYRIWQHRLLGTQSDARRSLASAPGELAREVEADIASIESEQTALAKRLHAGGTQERLFDDDAVADQSVQLWDQVRAAPRHESIWMFPGGKRSLSVRLDNRASSGGFARFAMIAFLGLVMLGAVRLMRRRADVFALKRWAPLLGVLGGAAWWLWFVPGWIGVAIIAGSLWVAIRRTQVARRTDRSSVVPLAS